MDQNTISRSSPSTSSRRHVLRGAGGVALAMPFLESLSRSRHGARAATPTRRLVVLFTPEGTSASQWFPKAGPTPEEFALSPLLQPLEPHKKDLIVFQGIDHLSSRAAGSTHHTSMVHMLTGGGPDSIDQIVARHTAGEHRFRSIDLSVKPRAVNEKGIMIYAGGRMIPGEYNPLRAFARLFTGGVAASADLLKGGTEALFQRRRSVIDMVKGELERLRARLGVDDRARVEGHLTAIRDVERSLTTPPLLAGPLCASPKVDLVAGENIPSGGPLDKIAKAQMELLVLALACDLTPVASLQISCSGSGESFAFLGNQPKDGLHGWVHTPSDATYKAFLPRVFTWFSEQCAQLITKLKAVDQGGRSLFEDTAILWGSHFGNGGGHTPNNVPWLIAGSAGGAFRTGRFLPFMGEPQNRLLLAVAQGFGARVDRIGDVKYGAAPLPGILA